MVHHFDVSDELETLGMSKMDEFQLTTSSGSSKR